MRGNRAPRLGGEALAPVRFGDHEREFHFGLAVDRPWQQPAAADEATGRFVDRRPQPERRVAGDAADEVLQFLGMRPAAASCPPEF